MEEKNILCPECGINYVSKRLFDINGKCTSCKQRERMARSYNKEYIKFIDLPKDEKEKILKVRQYVSLRQKEQRTTKNNKVVSRKRKKKKFSISNPKIVMQIREMSNENTTIREVYDKLCDMYPDEDISITNLRNLYYRSGFPYKKIKKLNDENKMELTSVVENNLIQDVENVSNDLDDISIQDIENLNEIDTMETNETNLDENKSHNIDISCIDDNKIFTNKLPDRFEPIKTEVKQTIVKKFDVLHCQIDKTYNTDDYINVIEILMYLKESIKYLVKARCSQHSIMNAYQQDVVHEIEKIIVPEGDTSITDKLHIIREYRRYFEIDYRDLMALKQLIESLDIDLMKQVLERLRYNKNIRENPIFRPLVDLNMIDKYEWAKSIENSSIKSNIDLTTYGTAILNNQQEEQKATKSKNKNVLKKYRVSCRVSGGGFGAFTPWYRDYLCTNSGIALAYATNTLNQLKQTRNGMMWTEPDVTELDVKYNTGNKIEIIDSHVDKLLNDMRKNELNTVTIPGTSGIKKYLISCHIESKKAKVNGTWNKIYICDELQQAEYYAQEELDSLKKYIKDMNIEALDSIEIG